MVIVQSKKKYEPRSLAHVEALEQTCRLRPLQGLETNIYVSRFLTVQVYNRKLQL
jgi:hypothetical protein